MQTALHVKQKHTDPEATRSDHKACRCERAGPCITQCLAQDPHEHVHTKSEEGRGCEKVNPGITEVEGHCRLPWFCSPAWRIRMEHVRPGGWPPEMLDLHGMTN